MLILDVARLLVRRPDDDADRLRTAAARAVDEASDAQAAGTCFSRSRAEIDRLLLA